MNKIKKIFAAGLMTLVAFLGAATAPANAVDSTTKVMHSDLATSFADVLSDPTKWFFYNDENDTIDNTLGSFVVGPSFAPEGDGSVKISVSGSQRRNIATYQFSGTPLADITTLKFSTYNPSLGNPGSVNRSGYLNFNVDFNGSDAWQRRLVYVPSDNGTVIQNTWQEWDAIDGGNAKWKYSGTTWPVTGELGFTTKTWNQILSDYPGVRVRVTDSWLGIRVGEPYADGYTENIDAFKFGTSAGIKTFDFEPNPYPIPAQCEDIEGLGAPIVGTSKSEKINGTAGNDLIFGLGGSDKIDGKGGHDCIVGGDGSDKLVGGTGNDVILGGNLSDSLEGNDGDDKLYGEDGSDSLRGGNHNDMLWGGNGSDSLRGGNGDDFLDGGDNNDTARGELGNDTCTAEVEKTCEL